MTFELFKKTTFCLLCACTDPQTLLKIGGNVYAKYIGTWEIRKKVGSYNNDQKRGVYSVETRANAQQIS
jgi:hypothetical protein